ncbi:hypothetical protein MMC06_004583 [Schaereria dolodes]|nr:hypothetical protein [Schaereria dolodes]
MALKRKRSASGLSRLTDSSYPSSDGESSTSSVHIPYSWSASTDNDTLMEESNYQLHQIDNWAMTINPIIPEVIPDHIHGRTRKRFRDNRPDENTIHQNTYDRLFAAQRSPSQHSIPSLPRATSISSSTSQRRPSGQASLHSFWTLPVRPTVARQPCTEFAFSQQQPPQPDLKCEDCDAYLGIAADENAMAMDIDTARTALEEAEFACRCCRRMVCGMCAVVVVDEGRECLQCKTSPKRWVGGIGWVQSVHM